MIHTRLERLRDRFDAGAQRALRRAMPPRASAEAELANDMDACFARWIAQHDPVRIASMVGARLGRLPYPAPREAARQTAQSFFVSRAEGDVPSAGGEP